MWGYDTGPLFLPGIDLSEGLMAHRFTIGVEEEFQIIDPETLGLRSHVVQLLKSASHNLGDQVKQEMHEWILRPEARFAKT